MRDRRTWFSAPLVVITAGTAGCSGSTANKDPTEDFAYINQRGTACTYSVPEHCPKGAMCNPPPPRSIECPIALEPGGNARIGPAPSGKAGECVAIVPPCYELACAVPSPCVPDGDWFAKLPPVQWAINPGDGDKCTATGASRTDYGGAIDPVTIDCPASLTDHHGFIERAKPTADCFACATSPCDTSAPVACPPDPPPPVPAQ